MLMILLTGSTSLSASCSMGDVTFPVQCLLVVGSLPMP